MNNNTKNKKKISIILPNLVAGGAEKVHVILANDWLKKGYSVDIVLMKKKGILINKLNNNINIINLNKKRIRELLLPLSSYLIKSKPEIILSSMWPITSISVLSWLISRKVGKLFLIDHTSMSKRYINFDLNINTLLVKIIMRLTYPLANSIITVSKGVRNNISNLSGISKKNIKVIYNPIEKIKLKKEENIKINSTKLFGNFDYKILGVGTLKPSKDFSTLIKAFAIVKNKINASLVIIGEGEEYSKLKLLINKLKLNKFVKLRGFQKNPYKWFRSADLYVHSSLYDGLPLVIIEAMSCGLPILSTNCDSGPSELLANGKYGKLIPLGNQHIMAREILKILKQKYNKSKRNQLIERSKKFSIETISDNYIKHFFKDKL